MTAFCMLFAAVASCVEPAPEAELARFGYRDFDLAATNLVFFSTAEAATNWVPVRLLRVAEDYEWTADEEALIAAAGVVTPCVPQAEIPPGYAKRYDEPWFTGWERPVEAFGFKGVAGMQTHYNEDAGRWDTGETYFSSYWPDEAGARSASEALGRRLADAYKAKRLHEFHGAWIAEYVRLLAMGVVGRTADGRWSCMLTFRDKSRVGCGEWTSVEEQRRRLGNYRYGKALKAFEAALEKALAANRAAIVRSRDARGLKALPEGFSAYPQEDGRTVQVMFGGFAYAVPESDAEVTNAMKAVWSERRAFVEEVSGVKLSEEAEMGRFPGGHALWCASGTNEMYDVRLDIAYPVRGMELAEGETLPTNGEYRVLLFERLQPGIELPTRPEPGF